MYEKALALKESFVRARHNLGVSCMNIGCYDEATGHLMHALSWHDPSHTNISTNLWETLRRNFVFCDRMDLASLCEVRSLRQINDVLKINGTR